MSLYMASPERLLIRVLASSPLRPLCMRELEKVVRDIGKVYDLKNYYPGVNPPGISRCLNRLLQAGLVVKQGDLWGLTYVGLIALAGFDVDAGLARMVDESKGLLIAEAIS